jgi:hypothetical protein
MMTDKARERKYERSTTNQFRRYQPCVAGICLGIAEYNSTVIMQAVIMQALGSRLKIAIQRVAEPQSYVRFGLRRQWSLRDASMRCTGFVIGTSSVNSRASPSSITNGQIAIGLLSAQGRPFSLRTGVTSIVVGAPAVCSSADGCGFGLARIEGRSATNPRSFPRTCSCCDYQGMRRLKVSLKSLVEVAGDVFNELDDAATNLGIFYAHE